MYSESEGSDMDKQSIYYEKVLSAAYRVWRDTHKDGSVRKMGRQAMTIPQVIANECEQLPPESYILTESTNLDAAYERTGFVTGLSWADTRRQVCRAAFAADIREILEENRQLWEDERNPNRLTEVSDIVDHIVAWGIPDAQLEERDEQEIVDEIIDNLASDGVIDEYRSDDYYRAEEAAREFISFTL
jgi:hypothetical protein